jgi:outer membrane protein TolC
LRDGISPSSVSTLRDDETAWLASQWAQRATRVTLVQDVAQAYFQLRSLNLKI